MRLLADPFRIDANGAAATVEQWSDAQRNQLVAGIVATVRGERGLAPMFGLADPVGRTLSEDEVRAAVQQCEPDVRVTGVRIAGPTGSRVSVQVSSVWRVDEES